MTDTHGIVARWLALWNGDPGELDTLVADRIVVHAALVGQANEGPLLGREALRGWIGVTQGMMPAIRFSVEVGPLVDGNLIAVRWRAQGLYGSMPISFTGTDILQVDNERIVEVWTNADTLLMMQQAGLSSLT